MKQMWIGKLYCFIKNLENIRVGESPVEWHCNVIIYLLSSFSLFFIQAMTLEGWVDIMYYLQDAYSSWVWVYFVALIVVSRNLMFITSKMSLIPGSHCTCVCIANVNQALYNLVNGRCRLYCPKTSSVSKWKLINWRLRHALWKCHFYFCVANIYLIKVKATFSKSAQTWHFPENFAECVPTYVEMYFPV